MATSKMAFPANGDMQLLGGRNSLPFPTIGSNSCQYFSLGEASEVFGNEDFDPDFGLEFVEEATPLQFVDIIDDVNDVLSRYGMDSLSDSDFKAEPETLDSEVGDDEQCATNSRAYAAGLPVIHERLGMKVSWKDTSINPRYGNFAEDLIILPDGYGQTYLNARKTSRFSDMSFIDICKLRLAIDIRPMRMEHSSTNDGKASMVGSRMRWIEPNSPWRGAYELLNLIQDVSLGLHRDRKFAYLPESLGGYGKEPPFRNYGNFERFLKAFKQGSHSLLIRNIVHRTVDFLGKQSQGLDPVKDPLLSHVVRFQSSFHDWIKGRSIYAPVTWVDVPPEVAKHRAGKLGESSVKDEILGRLLAEGKLLSEQKLEIAVEHNELCKALLKAESIPEFKRIREKARKEWNNLSIFSMENYGMIKEIILDQGLNSRPLRDIDVSLFYQTVYRLRYRLRHILGEEFVYFKEAMDEIYSRGPMMVHLTMYPRNKIGERSFAAPRSDYKSDVPDTEEMSGLDGLMDYVRANFTGHLDRSLLNDDNSIINDVQNHHYNIIVTDDWALCKEAARKTRNIVFRVPVRWYYLELYFGAPSWTDRLDQVLPGKVWETHIDSGSTKAFEENCFHDGVMLSRPRVQKFNFWKTLSERDVPVLEENLEYEYTISDQEMMRLLIDPRNELRLRGIRRGIRPIGTGRDSSSNWRHSEDSPL